jgi:hypothetical protein
VELGFLLKTGSKEGLSSLSIKIRKILPNSSETWYVPAPQVVVIIGVSCKKQRYQD